MACSSFLVMASLLWEKPSGRGWGRAVSEPEGGQKEARGRPCQCASPSEHLPEAGSKGEGLQSGSLVARGQGPWALRIFKISTWPCPQKVQRIFTLPPSSRAVLKVQHASESPGQLVKTEVWVDGGE